MSSVKPAFIDGRYLYEEGRVYNTCSGRETKPYPILSFKTNNSIGRSWSKQDKWALMEALEEARHLRDWFNFPVFKQELKGFKGRVTYRCSECIRRSVEYYLFDEKQHLEVVNNLEKAKSMTYRDEFACFDDD